MRVSLSLSCLCILFLNGLKAAEPPVGSEALEGHLQGENLDDTLKKVAEKSNLVEGAAASDDGFVYPYFFEIKDATDIIAARLNLTKGPFSLDLVKTKTNDKKKVVYVTNSKNQINVFESFFFNQTAAKTSAVVTGSGENGTQIEVTIAYDGMTGNKTFVVKSAEIKATIELGGPTRVDYWNITTASITVNSTVNGTATNLVVDLTPKFGYSAHSSDFACTTGYGICAPLGLCWSCNDQVMKPNSLDVVGSDKLTVFLHFPGMVLEPSLGGNKTTFQYGFGYNWDCDPLIPISLWVSLLITLMLATILFWALYMLSALQTPNKFDDPKGPSIHVPQAE